MVQRIGSFMGRGGTSSKRVRIGFGRVGWGWERGIWDKECKKEYIFIFPF
ncbi:hypothetical protein [Chryseobacterium formosense]|nr:hypothetical protein [Chryseobacterium formosense]